MKVPIQAEAREHLVKFDFFQALEERIKKHGDQTFINRHEGFGVIAEEVDELVEALRDKSEDANYQIAHEAMDLAIAAFWLYASAQVTRV